MKRFAFLVYGIACYAIFFATFLYTAGFLSNTLVPKSIDSGEPVSTGVAAVIDLSLLAVFAVQHSVMARTGFKRWWTRIVPRPIERSTYVLFSSLAMILLFWAWQPITSPVFTVNDAVGRAALTALFGVGLATVLYSTFLIDHFDLFGLRQVVLHFRGRPYTDKRFTTPSLYRHIRHPLYVGWFLTVWATPDMSLGHLLFASVASSYILVAIVFEERDLATLLGREYSEWRARTPMFVPRWRDRRSPAAPAVTVGAREEVAA